jgi:hypothetical protein
MRLNFCLVWRLGHAAGLILPSENGIYDGGMARSGNSDLRKSACFRSSLPGTAGGLPIQVFDPIRGRPQGGGGHTHQGRIRKFPLNFSKDF